MSDPREPPIVIASDADHWRCEGCGRVIRHGERVYLCVDEDVAVVTHVDCPPRAQA